MNKEKKIKEKRKKAVPIWLGMIIFMIAFGAGAASKVLISPSWAKEYSVKWSDELGTRLVDLSYGEGEMNKFDLYLPADKSHENYGLVIYLHPGGFTSGDKSGDADMCSWLCSKGYVSAGINYTLLAELENGGTNGASVFTQSNEIKAAVPKVIEAAEEQGCHIDKMTIAGGSAGHALAMIYAYRDAVSAPVPVVFTFGAVGPSCFYREDWDNYGFDRETEEAYQGAAGIFGAMLGEPLSAEEIKDGSYIEKMKPISAAAWITQDAPPTVVAYGTYDRVQPFKASIRLRTALEDHKIDFRYFEASHSGHGLQNDHAIYKQYMEAVCEYLDKYMPIE